MWGELQRPQGGNVGMRSRGGRECVGEKQRAPEPECGVSSGGGRECGGELALPSFFPHPLSI